MKINPNEFRLSEGKPVNLKSRPTRIADFYDSKKEYKDQLEDSVQQIGELQELLFASSRHSLLLIFQGMDTAGKDGAIGHVLTGVNPLGFQVYSFKQPSAEELKHDFLWRTTVRLPERGRIGVFNRSYYEEVLVVKVHPEFLQGQNLPQGFLDKKNIWSQRYRSINEFEQHMWQNGTRVVKFYLHLSKEEQAKRLMARIDDPQKKWKFNPGDIEERKLWPKYIQAYEACLTATSTKQAPWYVVPADDKKNARLIIASIVENELKGLKLKWPQASRAARKELGAIKSLLKSEIGEED